jgi:Site-specific recombinase XerD
MVMNVLPQDLSNVIIEYEKRLQEKEFSSHTKRAYVSRNKKFLSYLFEQEGVATLESQPAEEWPRMISGYREFLKSQQEASLNSINNSLTAIEDLFNSIGIETGKVDREAWPKTAPKVLTQQEQELFLNATYRAKSSKDKAIVLLLMFTGIKIGECAALDVDDIFITAHTGRITVKDGRIVPLNSVARRALIQWLIDRHKSSAIKQIELSSSTRKARESRQSEST